MEFIDMEMVSKVIVVEHVPVIGEELTCEVINYCNGNISKDEITTLPIKCVREMTEVYGIAETENGYYFFVLDGKYKYTSPYIIAVKAVPKVGKKISGHRLIIDEEGIKLKPYISIIPNKRITKNDSLVFVEAKKAPGIVIPYLCILME